MIFPHHDFLTEWKRLCIIETDDLIRMAEKEIYHQGVKKYQAIPIIKSKISEHIKEKGSARKQVLSFMRM